MIIFNQMVEYISELDKVFSALADPTRRDIITTVAHREYTVGELVARHSVSFAAVSKHLKVLEAAGLIINRKQGRNHMISLSPQPLLVVREYLQQC